MSDYGRIDPADLDRHITGAGGEDFFQAAHDDWHAAAPTGPDDPCPLCGKPLGSEQNVHNACAEYENGYADWVAEQMGKDEEGD